MHDLNHQVLASINAYRVRPWVIAYAKLRADGSHVYVVNAEDSNEYLVIRNDFNGGEFDQIDIQSIGMMTVHSPTEDPVFRHLDKFLTCFTDVQVLRYRPSKRITLAAVHPVWGKVIVKCVGSGVEPIFERLSILWQARAQLDFRVSEPISIVSMARLFVQSRLEGSPVDVANQELLIETAGHMASAVGSLHRSSVKWPEQFTVFDQLQRSERYLKEIEERFPALSRQIGEIRQKLSGGAKTFAAANRAVKPIHGSLHLHQWLLDRGGLSLVDFDRACMGDVELDLATFVAQWDYEAQPLRGAVTRAFMKAYVETGQSFDIDLFSYYRAHKHLSKAYKAAKGASAGTVPGKLAKRLSNTQRMLDQPQASV